jgi:hypothetical protein
MKGTPDMTSTSGPTTVYSLILLRLTLQPFWVRFVFWAAYAAVIWLMLASPISRSPMSSTVIFAVALGALSTYQGRATHNALAEAVSGLDESQRSQAIAAVTRGVMPADQRVRSAAIRLGAGYLRGKSADQLKRYERRAWIAWMVLVVVAASLIALPVMSSSTPVGLRVLAAVLLLLILLPLAQLSTRRIQRNVALLTEGRDAQWSIRRAP